MTALLFDLDGVLLQSVDAYRQAWTRLAELYGVETAAIAASVHGRRPVEVIGRVLPEALPEALETFDRLVEEAVALVSPMPGALELTSALSPGTWAIATSGSRRHVPPMLERAGIAPPEVLIFGDDTLRGKPDPECFLRAAGKLSADQSACTVVEDSVAGIEAGLAAGMAAVAVATTHPPEELARAGRVFPSLLAASAYLLGLARGKDGRPSP